MAVFPPSGPIMAEDLAGFLEQSFQILVSAPIPVAMQKCVDLARDQVTQQFETESDPEGNPWPEWEWTSEYPVVEHPTLDHTGMLKASFLTQQAGHVEEVNERDLIFGSEVNYANIHDQGASFILGIWLFGRHGGALRPGTRITIPQRQIVGWSEKTLALCDDAILDEFERQIFG